MGVSGRNGAKWVTVTILVYVNLINYMDRLTIAGKMKMALQMGDSRIEYGTVRSCNCNTAGLGYLEVGLKCPYKYPPWALRFDRTIMLLDMDSPSDKSALLLLADVQILGCYTY